MKSLTTFYCNFIDDNFDVDTWLCLGGCSTFSVDTACCEM